MKITSRFARPIVPRRPFVLHGSYRPSSADRTLRMEMPFPSVPEIPGSPSPSGPADPTGPGPGPAPQDARLCVGG